MTISTLSKIFAKLHLSVGACSDVQFTCWNDACISLSLHCDGVKDCTDNSDEIECGVYINNGSAAPKICHQRSWSKNL